MAPYHLLTANFRAFLTLEMPKNTKKREKNIWEAIKKGKKKKEPERPPALHIKVQPEPATTMQRSARQDVWTQLTGYISPKVVAHNGFQTGWFRCAFARNITVFKQLADGHIAPAWL